MKTDRVLQSKEARCSCEGAWGLPWNASCPWDLRGCQVTARPLLGMMGLAPCRPWLCPAVWPGVKQTCRLQDAGYQEVNAGGKGRQFLCSDPGLCGTAVTSRATWSLQVSCL